MTNVETNPPVDAPKPEVKKRTEWQDIITAVVGFLALIGFGWFIIYLTGQAADPDLDGLVWTRMTYLLTGVEAIAFAAAGYFFGKEVHRKQAENAEERADAASDQAADAETRATQAETNGKTLKKAISTAMTQKVTGGDVESFGRSEGEQNLSFLADLANELFPD